MSILSFDHFRSICEDFVTGSSKGQKNGRLLEFCSRREQVEALLASVKKANPTRYAQYEQRTVILDGLLNRGLDAGLETLTDRPEPLDQAVVQLRGREKEMRQARLRDLVADAADRARAEFKGKLEATGASLSQLLDPPPADPRVAHPPRET